MFQNLWVGSEASYDLVVSAQEKATEMLARGDMREFAPNLLQVQGSVGVINVQGGMINGYSGIMSLFGVVGYGDIRDAALSAVANPDVKSLLLNVNSPGGDVNGIHDLSHLLKQISDFKPIVTYTGGAMMSGGLWLGANGHRIFAGPTAEVGSLGVLSVHTEITKQLEDDGVKKTLIRSGRYKALNNPFEVLSVDARAAIQESSDEVYEVFLEHVAKARNVDPIVADARFGQGRTFTGKKALAVGLVDEISLADRAFAYAKSLAA